MTTKLFVYKCRPFDGWQDWRTVSEAADWIDRQDFAARLTAARTLARQQLGWDGAFREGPYVRQRDGELQIAWKQFKQGTTFFAVSNERHGLTAISTASCDFP